MQSEKTVLPEPVSTHSSRHSIKSTSPQSFPECQARLVPQDTHSQVSSFSVNPFTKLYSNYMFNVILSSLLDCPVCYCILNTQQTDWHITVFGKYSLNEDMNKLNFSYLHHSVLKQERNAYLLWQFFSTSQLATEKGFFLNPDLIMIDL